MRCVPKELDRSGGEKSASVIIRWRLDDGVSLAFYRVWSRLLRYPIVIPLFYTEAAILFSSVN